MSVAVPFPETLPAGYEWMDGEPVFDPERHLALETPTMAYTLAELGYDGDEIQTTATPVAVSHPFRVLSDEGARIMLETARMLRVHCAPAGDRIENTVRGGCYRSRWLRDLTLDPTVTAAMSSFYGIEVAPHSMPVHLGHLNYEPTVVSEAVDKWHHDTLPLDYVMPVTDPTQVPGGRFEYFVGTKAEAAELAASGEKPPLDRVVAPDFPGPGYAIALHGNMVVHRGAPLTAKAERISMVNGYITLDTTKDDQSRTRDLIGVDPDDVLYTEWVKHAAWRARTRLAEVEANAGFGLSAEDAAAQLEAAVVDVQQAIADMRGGMVNTSHYET